MRAKPFSIFLMLLCTLFTSVAQIFLKKGATNLILSKNVLVLLSTIMTNYSLLIGCFLYGLAALIFVVALKGGELSVLYPIIATSYFWVTLLAKIYLGETIDNLKWLGVFVIFVGITFVGLGGKNAN
ncbi:hypothetical protein HZA97_03265 [Candidatus Woesearchaeota archaeon]|nr:hypothetical protein [Candidatus Woesearchaeota archaeon]